VDSTFQPGGRQPAPSPLTLVQDFVNTEVPDFHLDELATPELLRDWLVGRGLLATGHAAVDKEAHARVVAVRQALRLLALSHSHDRGLTAAETASIRRALHRVPVRLTSVGSSVMLEPAGKGVDHGLGTILSLVEEAERAGTWSRFKACAKEGCGWAFYDSSRNRSSCWCSMKICGNRTKAAASRRRSREADL
jgi:predicted RNA-binding Zn ribbon-like protein